MLIRSILTSFGLALALGACATVSVVPGSTTVETSLTQKQSDLRLAALSFGDTATVRGWIEESTSLADLARVLVDGKSDTQIVRKTYADLIGAGIRPSEDILATLLSDVSDAHTALSLVSVEADAFLTGRTGLDTRTAREDLVSVERALVQAQRSRRAFIDAISVADMSETPVLVSALARLDREVTRVRDLADRMATEYSERDVSTSVS